MITGMLRFLDNDGKLARERASAVYPNVDFSSGTRMRNFIKALRENINVHLLLLFKLSISGIFLLFRLALLADLMYFQARFMAEWKEELCKIPGIADTGVLLPIFAAQCDPRTWSLEFFPPALQKKAREHFKYYLEINVEDPLDSLLMNLDEPPQDSPPQANTRTTKSSITWLTQRLRRMQRSGAGDDEEIPEIVRFIDFIDKHPNPPPEIMPFDFFDRHFEDFPSIRLIAHRVRFLYILFVFRYILLILSCWEFWPPPVRVRGYSILEELLSECSDTLFLRRLSPC